MTEESENEASFRERLITYLTTLLQEETVEYIQALISSTEELQRHRHEQPIIKNKQQSPPIEKPSPKIALLPVASRLECEHPMKNELILKKVFRYCSVSTLKSCRLTCDQWFQLSQKTWRNHAVFRTWTEESVFTLNSIRARNDRPFRRYHFDKAIVTQLRLSNPCWRNALCTSTTYLKLCDISPLQQQFIPLIFSRFPSLVCLELLFKRKWEPISLDEVAPHQSLKHLKLFIYLSEILFPLNQFVALMPKLQTLDIMDAGDGLDWWEGGMYAYEGHAKPLLRHLASVRRSSGTRDIFSLTELHIKHGKGCFNSTEIFRPLLRCEFPLQKLTFPFPDDAMTVRQILKEYAGTLESLTFFSRDSSKMQTQPILGNVYKYCKVPILMEKLKELVLVEGLSWGWGFRLIKSMKMPRLEKLSFEYEAATSPARRGVNASILASAFAKDSLPKVERLEWKNCQHLLSPRAIHVLSEAMPSLKQLEMPLGHRTFPKVCHVWPKLQTLKILDLKGQVDFRELNDESLTGILRGFGDVGEERQANITMLKDLTDFVMYEPIPGLKKGRTFGEVSVVQGFLQLPRLHYLSASFVGLSQDVKLALQRHVKNLEIREIPGPPIFSQDGGESSAEENESDHDDVELIGEAAQVPAEVCLRGRLNEAEARRRYEAEDEFSGSDMSVEELWNEEIQRERWRRGFHNDDRQ